MDYIIRECEENDLDTLVVLCSEHALYERANYNPDGKSGLLRNALFSDKPSLYAMVVSVSGKVVGYASYTFDFSTWDARKFLYMDCLYIQPEFRGNGIGEAFVIRLKEIGQLNHCVNMQWQTPVWNERAIKFYKRLGGMSKEKNRFSLPL